MRWLGRSFVFCSLALLVLLVDRCQSLASGEPCHTPTGTDGICTTVRNCSYALKVLGKVGFVKRDQDCLATLKCGEMHLPSRNQPIPLVCCPKVDNVPNCGAPKIADRIFGGEQTALGEHPWAALLFFRNVRNRIVPKCGGSLVSERFVITAAHCTVHRMKLKLMFVRFNEFNVSSTDNCFTGEHDERICRKDYEVESIIPHPGYEMYDTLNQHDISLLKLTEAVQFNAYIHPICLPFEPDVQRLKIADEMFTVAGWGKTETNAASDVLLHVELVGKDNKDCNVAYAKHKITLGEKQLCIGGDHGADSCVGDSGGPLMRQVSGTWFLVGVVSFGNAFCGTEDSPGVYTNVAKYLDWMETIMFV